MNPSRTFPPWGDGSIRFTDGPAPDSAEVRALKAEIARLTAPRCGRIYYHPHVQEHRVCALAPHLGEDDDPDDACWLANRAP